MRRKTRRSIWGSNKMKLMQTGRIFWQISPLLIFMFLPALAFGFWSALALFWLSRGKRRALFQRFCAAGLLRRWGKRVFLPFSFVQGRAFFPRGQKEKWGAQRRQPLRPPIFLCRGRGESSAARGKEGPGRGGRLCAALPGLAMQQGPCRASGSFGKIREKPEIGKQDKLLPDAGPYTAIF